MKRIIIYVTTLAVFSTLFTFNLQADVIRMAADDWCPYTCDSKKNPGYMVEIATRIFEKSGHKVEYKIRPWSRSIVDVRKGKMEAVLGATRGEVPGFVFPEESFGASLVYFFVKKGNPWRYTGIDSLKKVNVGAQGDFEYGGKLDEYFAKHKKTKKVQMIKSATPLKLNIKKLLAKRVDTVPDDHSVFYFRAKQMNVLDKIDEAGLLPVETQEDFDSVQIYMAFSPKNKNSKKYGEILSQGIREMRKSGELGKIMAKYGLKDWEKTIVEISKQIKK